MKLAGLATFLATVSLLLTVLAHYAMTLDSAGFAGRAAGVVEAGPVQSLIVDNVAARLTGQLGGSLGSQRGVQPTIDQAIREALANEQVLAQVRSAAASLQGQLLSGRAGSLTLTLPDIGAAIASSLQGRSPELAAEAERLGSITVVDVRIPPSAARAVNDLAYLGRDATLLIILTFALGVLALLLSPNRRRTLVGLGAGAGISGLLAAGTYFGGREVVLSQFSSPVARTAAGAVWSAYLGGLETLGAVLACAGAVVATITLLAGPGRSARASTRSRPAT